MRFTANQYDQGIESLRLAKEQLEPNGNSCSICGDSGHMAFECGHNPLVAVEMCKQIATQSEDLHETLHMLGGWHQSFGVQLGPRRIVQQPDEAVTAPKKDFDRCPWCDEQRPEVPGPPSSEPYVCLRHRHLVVRKEWGG